MKTKQDYYSFGFQHGGKLDAPAFDLNKEHTSWQAKAYVAGYKAGAIDLPKQPHNVARANEFFGINQNPSLQQVPKLEHGPIFAQGSDAFTLFGGPAFGGVKFGVRSAGKSSLVETGRLLAHISTQARTHKWGHGVLSHAVSLVQQIVATPDADKRRTRYQKSLDRLVQRHAK